LINSTRLHANHSVVHWYSWRTSKTSAFFVRGLCAGHLRRDGKTIFRTQTTSSAK